jgi:hypothetical protein
MTPWEVGELRRPRPREVAAGVVLTVTMTRP